MQNEQTQSQAGRQMDVGRCVDG